LRVNEFSQQLCGAALSAAFAKMAVAQQQTQDMSGKQHSMPEKPAEIAMLIYPGMTASCRRSDYAEHTQDSVPAPLPFTRSTRHNPELGIRPVKSGSGNL
jgi:hypothetical protein